MRSSVAALLEPRGVAVIGASNNPLKRGHQAIRALLADGFPHPVHPVNPRETQVLGLPACANVRDIDGPVDLALITTPAETVPEVLRDCGAKGVAAAVVIAAGFGESGADGRGLEEECARVAAQHGVKLVGPNTNGVLNLPARLNLVGIRDVPAGSVALLCQSGNMGLSLLSQAAERGIGVSAYVGIGNEAGVRYHELLDHLADDDGTEAVLVYAEGFRDGRALLSSAARLARRKPVVCYKAGRSEVAQRSALSHTGALAASPRVADALLRQVGAEVVERSDELLAVCEALLRQPPLRARKVAVLTDGGGHGTVAADALSGLGLELPELAADTRRRLADALPPAASTRNPVDVAGATDRDPRVFEPCLEALLDDPAVEGVVCTGLLGGYGLRFDETLREAEEEAARNMARLAAERGKALVVQSAYVSARPRAHELLRDAGVPLHESVETAARCVAALARRGAFLATAGARSVPAALPPRPDPETARALTEPEGRELLAGHGLALGEWRVASGADETARAVLDLSGPAAVKLISPEVSHKSDVGGVVLGVRSAEEARDAYQRIARGLRAARPDARMDGVLVAPMAPSGVELMAGASNDPTFGPLLVAGAGGTAVEALGDLAFRAAPCTARECAEMLDELAVAPLLDGLRGANPVDREPLVDLLVAISRIAADQENLLEADLNPIIAHHNGVSIADVRVVLGAARDAPTRPDALATHGQATAPRQPPTDRTANR